MPPPPPPEPSMQTVGKSHALLSELMPAELITKIFCLLPSFSDVFALAATCRRLRQIWESNVTTIYRQVAPRSIPCERHARRFLTDQDEAAVESSTTWSAEDVVRIVRNASVVEKAILQFEREIVCRVKAHGFPVEEYYGAGARKHPPTLTRTERPRFVRSYYRLWGMMKVDAAEWQSRLESMTLKQLYHLCEMSKLTQSVGREEVVPAPRHPDVPPDSVHAINSGRSEKRVTLEKRTWEHIEHTYQRVHHREAEDPWIHTKHEGYLWFIVMWDHWQACLREVVCGRRPMDPSPDASFEKQYLWDNSSDEES